MSVSFSSININWEVKRKRESPVSEDDVKALLSMARHIFGLGSYALRGPQERFRLNNRFFFDNSIAIKVITHKGEESFVPIFLKGLNPQEPFLFLKSITPRHIYDGLTSIEVGTSLQDFFEERAIDIPANRKILNVCVPIEQNRIELAQIEARRRFLELFVEWAGKPEKIVIIPCY